MNNKTQKGVKDIQFTIIYDKEIQQVLPSESIRKI